jgi:hypothetical protein
LTYKTYEFLNFGGIFAKAGGMCANFAKFGGRSLIFPLLK